MPLSPTLILASRSPRRIELLREAGYTFDIVPADIDEDALPEGHAPADAAVFLASGKASVVAHAHPQAVVLGADTVVAVGATLYGKADTPQAARQMLAALAGQQQEVITGVAVIAPGDAAPRTLAVRSIVEMKPMSDAQLDAYIASDAWRGKAGAYGIQDHDPQADPFVRITSGDYTNVVGLPMDAVRKLLAEAGVFPAAALP